VTVLLRDYRELEGTYDKLVAIEMIEAVGWLVIAGLLIPLCTSPAASHGL
jgi:cyclopropane fatty-acyl-phospholipid synthase-like methyltransferase